jgi:hypothetical protein
MVVYELAAEPFARLPADRFLLSLQVIPRVRPMCKQPHPDKIQILLN